MRGFEQRGEAVQPLRRQAGALLLVVVEERQQRLRESREVPLRDARLIRERVATAAIDRAEFLERVVLVEERARSVVDRLAGDRRVVGVHHAVHEADAEPARDETRLRVDDALEQRQRVVAAAGRFRVVASERVRREAGERFAIVARGEELEGADAHVARGHAREHRARQRALVAENGLACRHRRERACRGYAERRHRLAHEILAQHRPEGGASVSASREGRPARAFELDVASLPVGSDDLAEQDRPTVTELSHEAAELMSRIRERDGLGTGGKHVAREHLSSFGRGKLCRVEREQLRERSG